MLGQRQKTAQFQLLDQLVPEFVQLLLQFEPQLVSLVPPHLSNAKQALQALLGSWMITTVVLRLG